MSPSWRRLISWSSPCATFTNSTSPTGSQSGTPWRSSRSSRPVTPPAPRRRPPSSCQLLAWTPGLDRDCLDIYTNHCQGETRVIQCSPAQWPNSPTPVLQGDLMSQFLMSSRGTLFINRTSSRDTLLINRTSSQ